MTPAVVGRQPLVPDQVAMLAPFVEAGVFGSFEVQLATAMVRLQPDVDDQVVLALAVAARAPRFGHVCADLSRLAEQIVEADESAPRVGRLPWPPSAKWCGPSSGRRWCMTPGPWPSAPSVPWCGTPAGSISSATGTTSGPSPPIWFTGPGPAYRRAVTVTLTLSNRPSTICSIRPEPMDPTCSGRRSGGR